MKKILVIDDEPTITEIITLYAERLGYAADCACSGDQALSMLDRNSYWALICDFLMPGIDGLQMHAILQSRTGRSPERFILLTGTVLDEQVQRTAEEKNIIIFQKPFNFEGIKRIFQLLEDKSTT